MRTIALAALAMIAACTSATPPRYGAACECAAYPCELAGCGDGAACLGGTCAARCAADDDCGAGAVCDVRNGACAYACAAATDCPAGLDRCDGAACYGGPLVTE